jgi:putative addiction module component (TIGR02574 family)
MPVSMADYGLQQLSVEDRISLAQEIWDSIAEKVERMPFTEAQQREVDRWLAAH